LREILEEIKRIDDENKKIFNKIMKII